MEYPGVKSNIFDTCYSSLFIEAKKLLKQPGTFALYTGKVSKVNPRQENGLRSLKMAILTPTTCRAAEDLLNLTKTISKHF